MNKPCIGKNLQIDNTSVYPMYANPKTVKRAGTAKPHANSLMPIDENTEIYSGDCKRSRPGLKAISFPYKPNDCSSRTKMKFTNGTVVWYHEPIKRALNRATLKKSRRLRRGLTLTEHINQRLRQNQRSAKQRNEFLPTGIVFKKSLYHIND